MRLGNLVQRFLWPRPRSREVQDQHAQARTTPAGGRAGGGQKTAARVMPSSSLEAASSASASDPVPRGSYAWSPDAQALTHHGTQARPRLLPLRRFRSGSRGLAPAERGRRQAPAVVAEVQICEATATANTASSSSSSASASGGGGRLLFLRRALPDLRTSSKLAIHERAHSGEEQHRCTPPYPVPCLTVSVSRIFPQAVPTAAKLPGTNRPTSARSHTLARCAPDGSARRRFGQKSDVPRHERTHTGEKRSHVLARCAPGTAMLMFLRRFSRKSYVAPHERTHTGEKPHAGSMCPMRFVRPQGRRSPARADPHGREAVHACSMCCTSCADYP